MSTATMSIEDFTDDEIRKEYDERFGSAEPSLGDFKTWEIVDELHDRGEYPESEPPANLDEILDHVAEAARASPYAKRAYDLLRDAYPEAVRALAFHQSLIAGRMGGVL